MPLRLERLSESDIPIVTELHYESFLTSVITRVQYPKGATPDILSRTHKRYETSLKSDKSVRYLKVVEDDTGEIVAFAKWHIFETAEAESQRTDLGVREYAPEMNKEAASDFWAEIVKARKTMAGKPHCFLDILATHPAHMRRGAGAMLVRWGTSEADSLHLPCYLEASPEGHKLYENCGFKDTGFIRIDLGKYEAGLPVYTHAIMLRPVTP